MSRLSSVFWTPHQDGPQHLDAFSSMALKAMRELEPSSLVKQTPGKRKAQGLRGGHDARLSGTNPSQPLSTG